MSQAISVRKIGFFLLSSTAVLLVWVILTFSGTQLSRWVGSPEPIALTLFLAVVFSVGCSGVIVGGLAHMASQEGRGYDDGIRDAVRFCGERFLPLFGGAILLALALLISGGMINGLILILNQNATIGSFVTAVLFLPQFAVNALLLIGVLLGVVVFCAIAVERAGPISGVRRLVTLATQRTGSLVVNFAITLFAGLLLFAVLAFVVLTALFPTTMTNGGSMLPTGGMGGASGFSMPSSFGGDGGFGGSMSPFQTSGSMGAQQGGQTGRTGDWLRTLSSALIILTLLSFPVVYWVCAFTRYYESVLPTLPAL